MNPADVAPVAVDLSIWGLFLSAHWVVKSVMLGLLACSIWVWAIAIDKVMLYARTRRAMDRFANALVCPATAQHIAQRGIDVGVGRMRFLSQ